MAELALTYRDYTVGWICALEVEQAAARALLDSEHPRLPSIVGDTNIYYFGSINGHNIVIACLPDGETGNNPVSVVATRMIINFPLLRFGLMVGIGGGVPTPDYNDIRLGDVVVSSATGEFGGVVQYDRGKTVQEGLFIRTGSLNRPPDVLRQAVTGLRATYRLERSRFTEYLTQMVLKFDTFASPLVAKGSQDILFRPDYNHHKGFGAPTCESCDATQMIQRSPRSLDPAIHYGVIASGNQVMRNGIERDRISRELGGVLCFEMEAAGLMNTFPCLVIRGICDYSDSHKNKDWQAYAAAVAAVYAKELLGEIEPAAVERTPATAAAMNTPKAHWLVPFQRNEHFVGRDPQLNELSAKLSSEAHCQRVAVVGLGGVGKTQIVLEFAYRKREISLNCSIFWIPAVNSGTFEQAYLQIGQLLQIHGITEDSADVKQLVKARLSQESSGQWLLIIDNADDVDVLYKKRHGDNESLALIDYLPSSRYGSIIFTTRNRKAAVKQAGSNVIKIYEMDQADAKKILENTLIQTHILKEYEATVKLLELLACLPLAIVQAAAFINENETSISSYITLYEDGEDQAIELLSEDFEDRGRYRDKDMKNPIATTWLISFSQICLQDRLAADYLSFMSCLVPQRIPESLLPPAQSKIKMTAAIGTLTAYSFITKREMEQSFDLHRLVHLATRNWLTKTQSLAAWTERTLSRLADIFPGGDYKNRAK